MTAGNDETHGFDAPAGAARPSPIQTATHADAATHAGGSLPTEAQRAEKPAAGGVPSLPGYLLAEEVGRGGMGVVYRARDLAMNREVAVKVLMDGYDPDSSIAGRFVAEAQITGQLQHPGVPAVYQVGCGDDGRPFLAMKLIKGRTLDALLKSGEALNVPAVFEAIAQAMGYAHAHGVIHRDLKPSNVMVGSFGEVQVMDWGLAKVLTETPAPSAAVEAEARTEISTPKEFDGGLTQAGSVLGTPAYMAPEQAAGEVEKVDRRSDVFGLGAILCALVTHEPPFTGRDAEAVKLAALRGRTEAAFARLDASAAERELIALCKRCLAFEPTDRPADASAVADEIAALRAAADDRARQAELVLARAEVQAEEQRKRRRVVRAAAAALATVLLLGIAGTTVGLLRADRARIAAQSAQGAAETSLAETRAVLEFVESTVLNAARPEGQDGGLGRDVTLKQAIESAVPMMSDGFRGQPLIEARLRRTIGRSFFYLGDHKAAAAMLARACDLYKAELGPDHPETLQTLHFLAANTFAVGRRAEAAAINEQVLIRRKAVLGPDHLDTLMSMNNLAYNCFALGRYAEALRLREEMLQRSRARFGPDDNATLWGMLNLADSYAQLGRHAEALALREQTRAQRVAALGVDHPDTLLSMADLAFSYTAIGRLDEAAALHEETLRRRKRKLGVDHPQTLISMAGLAAAYAALGRQAEALALRQEALDRRKATLGVNHPRTLESMTDLADSLIRLGRPGEAIPILDEALRPDADRVTDPGAMRRAIDLRLTLFREARDAAGCRGLAALWERLGRTDADSLYTAAYLRAVAAAAAVVAGGDPAAAEDAEKATAWLKQAVAAGYKDREYIDHDKNLDVLRPRADFQALVKSLPNASSSAK